ncbi:HEPN domain-containing protein [Quatrionicoccus australiensis]|uniref:HEPN domain-containing protein n=1 Tax=Quatrionicoccus australiensis TaxID=138118 RepID=UPI001CF9AA35|nr:HEPN domain-containing protein [Quatrionicoccus australiensis]MCB4361357.1 hypothetical protein [Quatrionicoccus australiensis]
MKATFIALLHDVDISDDLGVGDKINGQMRISNNPSVISKLISSAHRTIIGKMEVASLLNGQPVIYCEYEVPADQTPIESLTSKLYEVQSFLLTTWTIRDNSINCEMGFLLYDEDGLATASSNFIAHLYSDSQGKKQIIRITREELRVMRNLYRNAISMPEHPFPRPTSQLTSEHTRLTRAFYLVNAARGDSDLAMRVAHYCTAFETLFATSQTELAHQLSERVTCFLHSAPGERLETYRKVKQAYALRSKVVHGSTIRNNKLIEIIETSVFCDDVLRSIIFKLMTDSATRLIFEKRAEAFDEHMLKTIFSAGA